MTGAAWLSSARVVRCTLKWGNERNPYLVLQVSQETAVFKTEEGEDDVKSAWPLCLGRHTCYNGRYNGLRTREGERILKTGLSSDWSLQPDSMKLESLVTAYQPRRGEYVLGFCTHRLSSQESREHPKAHVCGTKVRPMIGAKS